MSDKFCVNCEFFEWRGEYRSQYGFCSNTAAASRLDVVTGTQFEVGGSEIYTIRGPGGACGVEGRYFQAKETALLPRTWPGIGEPI